MADDDGTNPVPKRPTNNTTRRQQSPDDVAETVAELASVYARDATNTAVAVLDGAGCALRVRYGALVAEDGLGRHRRVRRWTRALPPSRVVILSDSGFIGLDAIAWCEAVGTDIIGIDSHRGRLRYETTATKSKRDRRLVRAQAIAGMADDHPTGVAIVRRLLRAKLAGQERLVRTTLALPETAQTIAALGDALHDVASIEQARQLEASAAAAYFAGWINHDRTRMRFADRDRARIPDHWVRYDGRRSILGGRNSNRRATHPLNAMCNYLFALAKAEAVLALRIVGLDPDLGLLHLDSAGRPSMALDVIEPVRPQVEAFALELISQRVFRKIEFAESPDGSVRLGVALRAELAATLPRWATAVAPHAEAVAHALTELVATDYRPTAPITGTKRKQATARVRARNAASGAARIQLAARTVTTEQSRFVPTCVECGGPLVRGRHQRCPSCWTQQAGQDEPTRRKRGRAIAATRAELERWKAEHPGDLADPAQFRRDILPGLANVKLAEIMTACAISKASASTIRSGKHTPALRHWETLAQLADRERRTV